MFSIFIIATIFMCNTLINSMFAQDPQSKVNLADVLPGRNEILPWIPSGEAETVEGKDLNYIINGGAEIYYEYGFKQALFQTYSDTSNNSINLEICEMQDSPAAYGIYTFKRGSGCKLIEAGRESCLQDYYLNFWKGPFLVTITGSSEKSEIISAIIKMANFVDKKLDYDSEYPRIIELLPEDETVQTSIVYLKGNLGLFNQYLFDHKNIFAMEEGVAFESGSILVFLFEYKDQDQAINRCMVSIGHLKQSKLFSDFIMTDERMEMIDKDKNKVVACCFKKWIVIGIGQNSDQVENTVNSMVENMQ